MPAPSQTHTHMHAGAFLPSAAFPSLLFHSPTHPVSLHLPPILFPLRSSLLPPPLHHIAHIHPVVVAPLPGRTQDCGVDIFTLGQYLQPTPQHLPVVEMVHPDRFEHWRRFGEEEVGFR